MANAWRNRSSSYGAEEGFEAGCLQSGYIQALPMAVCAVAHLADRGTAPWEPVRGAGGVFDSEEQPACGARGKLQIGSDEIAYRC